MISDDFIEKLAKEGAKPALSSPNMVVLRWLAFFGLYFASLMAFSGFRADIALKIVEPFFLTEIALMILVTISAAYATSFLALPDSNQRSWVRFLPFIPLSILLALVIYGMIFFDQSLSLLDCFKMNRYDCIIHIMFYSAFPGLWMFLVVKRAVPIKCCFTGAMAGLASASFGYVAFRFASQRSDDPTSLLVWHFVPVVLIVMVGMLIGKIALGKVCKKTINLN